jgi:hypothetical protein
MKSLKDRCVDFFKDKDIRNDMKELITPVFDMIYNDMYVYIWLICIYNIFLIILIIINLYLSHRIINKYDLFLISRYGY